MYTKKKKKEKRKGVGGKQRHTPTGLTKKEEFFAEEYLKHFNATKAAIAAGYNPGTIKEKGWKILQVPQVKNYIDEKIRARYKELRIDQLDIVRKYQAIAFFDISVLYDENNDFVGFDNLSPEQRIIIKSINKKVTRVGNNAHRTTIQIELHDQQQALEKLAMHLGMFRQIVQIDQKQELTLKVEELKKLGTNNLLQLDRILSQQN